MFVKQPCMHRSVLHARHFSVDAELYARNSSLHAKQFCAYTTVRLRSYQLAYYITVFM
ncbi:hypothetical protein HMPREF3190_00073 [Umbribacter vaginalis]|nr:hypothetical protein HMPREF3190_00073 [Coriobacteriales bacterium DNF00809]